MDTILVVAYHYPPEEGSCSEKNIRIVKKLVKGKYNVIVLTKAYKNYPSVEENNGVTIVRTMRNGIFHKVQDKEIRSVKNTSSKSIKAKIANAIIPDATIDWFPEVRKTYKQFYRLFSQCKIILSISSPYSAHLVSNYLSKKMNIPFIMCYGDPWIYEPKRKRGKLRFLLEKNIEKSLLNRAKRILLITDWNKRMYHQLYNIEENKILTYNIGYDADECLNCIENSEHKEINIIYGGSLDKVHRNPEPFIQALKDIDGVKFHLYNSDNEEVPALIKKYHVEDKVILQPIIPSKEFYKKLYEMDILLLFGNKTPFQVPGKVFTYISTKRAILYIKNNDSLDDGTEMILKKYGNADIIRNTSNEISDYISKIKENIKTCRKAYSEEFEYNKTMQPIENAIRMELSK